MSAAPLVVDVGAAQLACLVAGDDAAPLVICAHGFPDGARSFRHQLGPLVDAGYRVVVPTLRGYAPSSLARDGRYDAAALGADLVALADRFSPASPVRLVGHDWGAIAAFAASALAPERFSHLCTIAVPHLRTAWRGFLTPAQLRRSWYIAFFQLGSLAERLVAARDLALIDRLWRAWSPGWQPPDDELEAVKNGFREPSHLRAVLGYYRALRSPKRDASRLVLARTKVPALHLHGIDDGCVGVELCDGMERAYASGVRVVRIAGGGHFVHQERPDLVNPELLSFLGSVGRHPAKSSRQLG